MQNTALTVFGLCAIVCLCVVAYFPLNERLSQADVLELSWGLALKTSMPIWLTFFGVIGGVVLVASSSKGVTAR